MSRDLLIEKWNPTIISNGTAYWQNDIGQIHGKGDQPAVVGANGRMEWHKYGKLHRNGDKPAFIRPNKEMQWFKNGILHRDNNKPAVICSDGRMSWYKNGENYIPSQKT